MLFFVRVRTSELHDDLLAVFGALYDVVGDALVLASEHVLAERQHVDVLYLAGAHFDPLVAGRRVGVGRALHHLTRVVVVLLRHDGDVARGRCGANNMAAVYPCFACSLFASLWLSWHKLLAACTG